MGLMLAIAGSFTEKDRREVVEPIKTQGPVFITVLVVSNFSSYSPYFLPILGYRTIFTLVGGMIVMKIFENIKMRMNQANTKNKGSAILSNDNNNHTISNSNNNGNDNGNNHAGHKIKSALNSINKRVIIDSITKLDPRYLAKNNPVMFTVEVGFIVVLVISLLPANISIEFVNQSNALYFRTHNTDYNCMVCYIFRGAI